MVVGLMTATPMSDQEADNFKDLAMRASFFYNELKAYGCSDALSENMVLLWGEWVCNNREGGDEQDSSS